MAIINALQIVSVTDPGRIRGHNEDCVESRPELGVVVLADGMGGYNAGEVASGMATSLIAAGRLSHESSELVLLEHLCELKCCRAIRCINQDHDATLIAWRGER